MHFEGYNNPKHGCSELEHETRKKGVFLFSFLFDVEHIWLSASGSSKAVAATPLRDQVELNEPKFSNPIGAIYTDISAAESVRETCHIWQHLREIK